MKRLFFFLITVILSMYSAGCSSNAVTENSETDSVPFQELYDQGIDRYLGSFTPSSSQTVVPGMTEHFFSGEDDPVCYTGEQFSMTTRDASSDDLLIFLQGGGFCSPFGCEAVEEGIPLFPLGILNPTDPQNPAANFDVGYVPYCDGSGMMGDNAVDSDGDGVNDRFFRGVQNLSASLDVIAQSYPAPDKIVIAGNSAGGFAVHAALPLVRKLYPDVQIDVINDSGVGVLDPGGMQTLIEYWNASAFFPTSCMDCIGSDGNLTDYHKYQLAQDPDTRMAYISSKQDATFADLIQGGGSAFEAQLIEAANELNEAFPDRFNSLITNGDQHTFLIRDFTFQLNNTSIRSWVGEMINETSSWDQLIASIEPVETGLLNRTFVHDGKSLEYALYIPSSYTSDEEVPLVVYLHGAPENKEIAQSTTDFTTVSEAEEFIILYPEAGYASSGGFIWADGRGGNADNSSDDIGYLNALIDSITEEFEIDASKRYLSGFSNGGFMVQNIANDDHSRFAAMATVSASIHESFESSNPDPIPMLYVYGTDDPVIDYENGGLPPAQINLDEWTVPALDIESAVEYWVGINECNTTPSETMINDSDTSDNSTVTIFEYTGCSDNKGVTFYRINGGGHTWPGVQSNGRPAQFFEDTNNDINAGQELWDFFKKFELN